MNSNNPDFWSVISPVISPVIATVILSLVRPLIRWLKKKFFGEDIEINRFNSERKDYLGMARLDFN